MLISRAKRPDTKTPRPTPLISKTSGRRRVKGREYYQDLARAKGLTQYGELLRWLKSECGLGHGHANAIILYIQNPELAKRKMAAETKEK